MKFSFIKIILTITACYFAIFSTVAEADKIKWRIVVDNNNSPPGVSTEKFFSYNQPSVNDNGLVVFRARAKIPTGGSSGGEPTRGVFIRNMKKSSVIGVIASTKSPTDVVPPPNNVTNPNPATFNEFPAFPRIDKTSSTVAFRGQSQPSWEDLVLGKLGGTTGIYSTPRGSFITGVRNLEIATGFSSFFVPGSILSNPSVSAKFDQFPGAPAISGKDIITFKGNYSDNGVAKTGIFYRNKINRNTGIKAIAWAGRFIPNKNGKRTRAIFGSTAPPSTVGNEVVFAGFDNEESPTVGGIYHAFLSPKFPQLKALVNIGTKVPNTKKSRFTRFGEAISFDGRYLTFWGAWDTGALDPVFGGDGWKPIVLNCPTDGNKAVIQSCLDQDNNGTANDGTYTLFEPINQGIFLYDLTDQKISMVARTNNKYQFNDFLFWSFTGAPPGVGGGDEGSTEDRELPRWRSSAFAAVNDLNVAFKAKKSDGTNGIYLQRDHGRIRTVLNNTMTGAVLDKQTIITVNNKDGSSANVPLSQLYITSLGLERDGFRNKRLTISASMADVTATYSWAGIYLGLLIDN